jgi:excisionase family DNA binding protein
VLVIEAALFLIGLAIFLIGKVKLSNRKTVMGSSARAIGLVFTIPLVLSFCGSAMVEYPMGRPSNIQPPDNITDAAVTLLVIVSCLLLSLIIGFAAPEIPSVLTPEEAARYLKVEEIEVRRLIEDGDLKAKAIGGDYRISKEALEEFMR